VPSISYKDDHAVKFIESVEVPKVKFSPLDKIPGEVTSSIGEAKDKVDKMEEILKEN
jgi:cob(I)alamin adenosyltransferase